MAKPGAQDFIQRLERDAAFRTQTGITSTDISLADFQTKAAAAGYDYTPEEILAAADANKTDTLTDADLEQVAGGILFAQFRFKLVAVKTVSYPKR